VRAWTAAVRDNDGDAAETARYLEIPLGLVQAAISYYGAYREEIDKARLARRLEGCRSQGAPVSPLGDNPQYPGTGIPPRLERRDPDRSRVQPGQPGRPGGRAGQEISRHRRIRASPWPAGCRG